MLLLETNARVPAGCVLPKAIPSEPANPKFFSIDAPHPKETMFIRQDQLDDESDLKIRRAVAATYSMPRVEDNLFSDCVIEAEGPKR